MAYDDTIARMQMKDCPICIDMTYIDADGLEHILFDICEVHMKVTDHARRIGERDGRGNVKGDRGGERDRGGGLQ